MLDPGRSNGAQGGVEKADALRPAYGKSLLMSGLLEDITLPVHPHIAVPSLTVDDDLRSGFRIVRQEEFRIVERKEDGMGGPAIDVAHSNGDSASSLAMQMSGSPEEGKRMCPMLVLAAFPCGNIMVDVGRIFVGPFINCGVGTKFQADLWYWSIRQAGLQAKAREGISLDDVAVELIVLKECQCPDLQGEGTHMGAVRLIRFST